MRANKPNRRLPKNRRQKSPLPTQRLRMVRAVTWPWTMRQVAAMIPEVMKRVRVQLLLNRIEWRDKSRVHIFGIIETYKYYLAIIIITNDVFQTCRSKNTSTSFRYNIYSFNLAKNNSTKILFTTFLTMYEFMPYIFILYICLLSYNSANVKRDLSFMSRFFLRPFISFHSFGYSFF